MEITMVSDENVDVSFQAPDYMKNYQECRRLGIYVDVSAHCLHPNSSDLTIYSAHSLLLSSSSPYLNLLLESSFREKPNRRSLSKCSVTVLQQNMLIPFNSSCSFNKMDNSLQLCLESCCNSESQVGYKEHNLKKLKKQSLASSDADDCTHKCVTLKSFLSNTNEVVLIIKGLHPLYFKYLLSSIYNENFSIEIKHIWKFLNFIKKLELSSFEIVKEKVKKAINTYNISNDTYPLQQGIDQNDSLKFFSNKLSTGSECNFFISDNIQNLESIDNSDKYGSIEKEEIARHNPEIVHNDMIAKFNTVVNDSNTGYSFPIYSPDNYESCCYDKENKEWLNFYNLTNKFNESCDHDKNLNLPNNTLQPDVISSSVKNNNYKIANLLVQNLKNSCENTFSDESSINLPTSTKHMPELWLTPANVNASLMVNTSCQASAQTQYDCTSVYSFVPLSLSTKDSTTPVTVTNCSSKTEHLTFSNEMLNVNEISNKFCGGEVSVKMGSLNEHVSETDNDLNSLNSESSRIILEHETKIYLCKKVNDDFKMKAQSNDGNNLQCSASEIIPSPHLSVSGFTTVRPNDNLSNNNELTMVSNTDNEFATVSCNQMIDQGYFPKCTNNMQCKKIKTRTHQSDRKVVFHKPMKNFPNDTNSYAEENIPLKSITSIRVVSFRSTKSLVNKKGMKVKPKYDNIQGSKCYFDKECQSILPMTLKKTRKQARKSIVDSSDASFGLKMESKSPTVFDVHEQNHKAKKFIFEENVNCTKNHSMSVKPNLTEASKYEILKDCSETCESNAISTCNKKELSNFPKVIVDNEFGFSADKCLPKNCKKQSCDENVNDLQETVSSCIICSFKSSSITDMYEHVKFIHYSGSIKHANCYDIKCPVKHTPYDSGKHIMHHIFKFQHLCAKCSFSSSTVKGIRVHCYAHKKHSMNTGEGLISVEENSSNKLKTSKRINNSERHNGIFLQAPTTRSHNKKKYSLMQGIDVDGTLATSIMGKLCRGIVKRSKIFPNQYKLCLEKAIKSDLSSSLSFGLKKYPIGLVTAENKKNLLMSKFKKTEMLKNAQIKMSRSKSIFKKKLGVIKNDLMHLKDGSKILPLKKNKIKLNGNEKSETRDDSMVEIIEGFTINGAVMNKSSTLESISKFDCLLCKATLMESCDLADHYFDNHRFSLPFTCPFKNCKVNITCAAQLRNHASSHTRKAKFDCSTCSYSCPTKNGIIIHSKMHKENPAKKFKRQ